MSNQMRWRYGDTSPVVFQVAADTVIEIGDLLYVDDDEVKPAGEQEDQASPAGNQELFHDSFAGVAMQQSPAGEAEPIRVATRGVFEFDASTGAYEIGDFLGPDENVSGDALENQKVTDVAGPNLAVGRCVRRPASVANSVMVEIVSTVVHGGPQGAE